MIFDNYFNGGGFAGMCDRLLLILQNILGQSGTSYYHADW